MAADVKGFLQQFHALDASCDGYVTRAELERFAHDRQERLSRMSRRQSAQMRRIARAVHDDAGDAEARAAAWALPSSAAWSSGKLDSKLSLVKELSETEDARAVFQRQATRAKTLRELRAARPPSGPRTAGSTAPPTAAADRDAARL